MHSVYSFPFEVTPFNIDFCNSITFLTQPFDHQKIGLFVIEFSCKLPCYTPTWEWRWIAMNWGSSVMLLEKSPTLELSR